jgi:hypothetical protein
MVGTRRLELLTSTVSIYHDLSFQRLTFSAGAAKSLEGTTRTRVLWVRLWVESRGSHNMDDISYRVGNLPKRVIELR